MDVAKNNTVKCLDRYYILGSVSSDSQLGKESSGLSKRQQMENAIGVKESWWRRWILYWTSRNTWELNVKMGRGSSIKLVMAQEALYTGHEE